MLLGVLRDQLKDSLRGLRVGGSVRVVSVIHALEGIQDEEEGLPLVLGRVPHLGAVVQEGGDVDLIGSHEVTQESESLRGHPELEERLLTRVEDHGRTVPGQSVREEEHGRGLSGASSAREESHRARSETLSAEGGVPILQARGNLLLHCVRNLDLIQGGSELEGVIHLDPHLNSLIGWFAVPWLGYSTTRRSRCTGQRCHWS